MAHEKPGWKNTLQAIQSKRSGSNDPPDTRESKKKSRLMFNRRKLDKDVRTYTKNTIRINSREIEAIGRRHGFHIEESLFRADKEARDNA